MEYSNEMITMLRTLADAPGASGFEDAVVEAAKDGPFLSKDDFRQGTKVSKTVIELMSDLGLFGDLPESKQLSLFDL